MLEQVLPYFPPHTHPLTLVSDPDAVLVDEHISLALAERGFRRIQEPDPIALRAQVQHVLPFTPQAPLIIITVEPTNTLPYDLWDQGYSVALDLHRIFPNLAYPVLQELSPNERWRLSQVQARTGIPLEPLSSLETIEYLLQRVFDAPTAQLSSPGRLIEWLAAYHAQHDPMPLVLARHFLRRLKTLTFFAGWPLDELLSSAEAYQHFIQQEWAGYVRQRVSGKISEQSVVYEVGPFLPFETDPGLQDILPGLIRRGALRPVKIAPAASLPDWAELAIIHDTQDPRPQQITGGLLAIEQQITAGEVSWEQWQEIATRWAHICLWCYAPDLHAPDSLLEDFHRMQASLDAAFYSWLALHYGTLATRMLPPHHLYHVPKWLAFQREKKPDRRLALLVLDGMSLADWLQIHEVWQDRHQDWHLDAKLLLAQVPTITAISRQALISGRRPNQFAATLQHNDKEKQYWTDFWENERLPRHAIGHAKLPTTIGSAYPDMIESRFTQVLCLTSTVIDEMVHGNNLGTSGIQAAIQVWLQQNDAQRGARWMEGLIEHLLENNYAVHLTSDHGHVEALGIGQPSQGIIPLARNKRARIYDSHELASTAQMHYPDTILWHDDGLLPKDIWVLMPQGRRAFAQVGEQVASHGGLTLEEMIVPLVTITKR